MTIAENVARVRDAINEAALRAGLDGRAVRLVAATKQNPAQRVREAVLAGVDACGENRVQELCEKLEQEAYTGVPVHLIGHLQRNKLRLVVGRVDLIESADSAELLRLISARAESLGCVQELLAEVNIGRESQKTGLLPEQLDEFLSLAAELPAVRVRGLMAIPPAGESRRSFALMRQLFVDTAAKKYNNVTMDFLSMGMSADYEAAVSEGANMVRVGTAIFGPRNY